MTPSLALLHLLTALLAGSLIGLERTYRGRAAGARTYALVCTASALMMVIVGWPGAWIGAGVPSIASAAPQIIQGILTGIGFLGAGVIVRDGYSVRGLTSAASVWATAAIGIVIGLGYLVPGLLFAVMTLGILGFMRHLENAVTAQHHVRCQINCAIGDTLSEDAVREILTAHHFKIKEMSYDMDRARGDMRYSADVWAHGKKHARHLALALYATPEIRGFQIVPSRD